MCDAFTSRHFYTASVSQPESLTSNVETGITAPQQYFLGTYHPAHPWIYRESPAQDPSSGSNYNAVRRVIYLFLPDTSNSPNLDFPQDLISPTPSLHGASLSLNTPNRATADCLLSTVPGATRLSYFHILRRTCRSLHSSAEEPSKKEIRVWENTEWYLQRYPDSTAFLRDTGEWGKAVVYSIAVDGEEQPAGYIVLSLHEDRNVYIPLLYVNSSQRGRGLGPRLLQYVLDRAVEVYGKGEEEVTVWVTCDGENDRAKGVYEGCGFEVVGGRWCVRGVLGGG